MESSTALVLKSRYLYFISFSFCRAVPLQEIAGHADTIDCGQILGNRSFKISTSHIDIYGFGKDCSGSLNYLADFLGILD